MTPVPCFGKMADRPRVSDTWMGAMEGYHGPLGVTSMSTVEAGLMLELPEAHKGYTCTAGPSKKQQTNSNKNNLQFISSEGGLHNFASCRMHVTHQWLCKRFDDTFMLFYWKQINTRVQVDWQRKYVQHWMKKWFCNETNHMQITWLIRPIT